MLPIPKRISPQAGQESVWDYPRPPRLEQTDRQIVVIFNGVVIAETRRPIRILETSHPPAYYLSPEDVQMAYFKPLTRTTFCEFKGMASYYDIQVGDKVASAAAWTYRTPSTGYAALKDYISLYVGRMDKVTLNGEQVRPQAGNFYGGWITDEIVGPFKGDAGTNGW